MRRRARRADAGLQGTRGAIRGTRANASRSARGHSAFGFGPPGFSGSGESRSRSMCSMSCLVFPSARRGLEARDFKGRARKSGGSGRWNALIWRFKAQNEVLFAHGRRSPPKGRPTPPARPGPVHPLCGPGGAGAGHRGPPPAPDPGRARHPLHAGGRRPRRGDLRDLARGGGRAPSPTPPRSGRSRIWCARWAGLAARLPELGRAELEELDRLTRSIAGECRRLLRRIERGNDALRR